MTIAEVENQLRDTYLDWRDLLMNPRFSRNGNQISWSRFALGIVREPVTYEKVRSLVETKQYSFQCAEDGSVFQLLYQFVSETELELARLGFYKANLPLSDEEIDFLGPLPEFTDVYIPWMRFDYTQQYASGVLHHESHCHISGFPDSRFVVAGVPGPRQFVEFIIASCYPEYYKIHRLDNVGRYSDTTLMKEINLCCRRDASVGIRENIIHFQVP